MNIKAYQNNFNAYSPLNYNKQTKQTKEPTLNTIEDTKPLTVNRVETDMDLILVDIYNNKGQIAKPKEGLKVNESYVPPENPKTEREKFLEEVNIVNKMDKDLFTEKQIEDVKKIVSYINYDDIFNGNSGDSAKIGLAVSQLKYYANNYMDENQREQFLKDIDKGMGKIQEKLEEDMKLINNMRQKIYDDSIRAGIYLDKNNFEPVKLENYYDYKIMSSFSKVDAGNKESFQKIFNDYKNSEYNRVNNDYSRNLVSKRLEEIQKMWDDFKHLIK